MCYNCSMKINKYIRATKLFKKNEFPFCHDGQYKDINEQLKHDCYSLNITIAVMMYSYLMAFLDAKPGIPNGYTVEQWEGEIKSAADGFKKYIELDFNGNLSKRNDKNMHRNFARSMDWVRDNIGKLWY